MLQKQAEFPILLALVYNRDMTSDPARYRVLMLAASPFPFPQGSQVLVAGLAAALAARGHQVEIATYPCGEAGPAAAVPLQRVAAPRFLLRPDPRPSFRKPLLDFLLARLALRAARRMQPDILHAHNVEGLLVALWVRRHTGIPVVYHLHNRMEPELPAYFRSPLGRWAGRTVGRWADRHLLRQADACIVLHAAAARDLPADGVAPARIHVIPPGVTRFDLAPACAETARHCWGLGPGPLALYSGNLDVYQDLELLLAAFTGVQERQPETRLVLATHLPAGGSRERALRKALGAGVRLLTGVKWEAMRGLLAAADIAVSPRQACWGFPIKVLNYMAAGRPIVAAAGSAQGLVHMETALVVPNGDTPAFAQAILTLLEDRGLAARLGQAARFEVEYRYTWPACAAAVEHVYGLLTTRTG